MKKILSIFLFIYLSLISSFISAKEIFTEAELFIKFKDENSCWYNTEDKMVQETDKIINFLKKFSTKLNSNEEDFWKEVNNKIKLRFPNFNYAMCEEGYEEANLEDEVSEEMLTWWENNQWFGENDEMTSFAIDIHDELEESGIEIESDAYFNALNEKMRAQFPNYFSENNDLVINDNSSQIINDDYTLSVDGHDLIFEGDIESSLYADIKYILKNNPAISKLVLKSQGGLEEEALDIADLIIDFDLDTHAFICESSCTLLFIAGNKRTLQRGHKLGFHRTYWSAESLERYYDYYQEDYDSVFDFTSWVYDDTQNMLFKKFEFLIERGVEPLFIIKTLQADSDGMWFPRRKELKNANFIND